MQIQALADIIDRLFSCLKIKQQEIAEQISTSYQVSAEDLAIQTKKISEGRDIIERNYGLMKNLFIMVPEPILNVEETFLKNISTTNISILENIQK